MRFFSEKPCWAGGQLYLLIDRPTNKQQPLLPFGLLVMLPMHMPLELSGFVGTTTTNPHTPTWPHG